MPGLTRHDLYVLLKHFLKETNMELKITFNNVSELKKQMVEIMEAFEPIQQYELVPQPIDTSTITASEVASQDAKLEAAIEKALDGAYKGVTPEIYDDVRPKAKRKTKAERQKDLAPKEPVHVPTDEDDEETATNFYSPIEFKLGFPRIMASLIDGGHLTHQHLNDYSQMYGVKVILDLQRAPEKLDAFYKQLVAEKVIVEKGDY
jgi:hypothetical protein